jgi:predicted metal-dependent phosphotriesterase family hydrolase
MPIPTSIALGGAGASSWHPLHFVRDVAPQLRQGGASDAQISALLVDNPRRFVAGEKLPALA